MVAPVEVVALRLEVDSLPALAVEVEIDLGPELAAVGMIPEYIVRVYHKKAHLAVGSQSSVGFVAALCLYPPID